MRESEPPFPLSFFPLFLLLSRHPDHPFRLFLESVFSLPPSNTLEGFPGELLYLHKCGDVSLPRAIFMHLTASLHFEHAIVFIVLISDYFFHKNSMYFLSWPFNIGLAKFLWWLCSM